MDQLIDLKIAQPGMLRGLRVPHSKFGRGPECSWSLAPYVGGSSALRQQALGKGDQRSVLARPLAG